MNRYLYPNHDWNERVSAECYAPNAASRILGAERRAIAQAYSHLIMPLADGRDRRTQVLWGIRDFQRRFQRRPEGMWLPETAADLRTLEILAEAGILFTILAPGQAGRIHRLGEPEWQAWRQGFRRLGEPLEVTA